MPVRPAILITLAVLTVAAEPAGGRQLPGALSAREAVTPEWILEVRATPTRPVEGGHEATLVVRWGDLDGIVPRCAKEHYRNWDGSVEVRHGSAEVVRRLAFDDGKARAPRVGSGADELLDDGYSGSVAWRAGTVGATDGLVLRLRLDHPASEVVVRAGDLVRRVTVVPAGG